MEEGSRLDHVREEGRREGARAALQLGILDLCEASRLPVTEARRVELEAMGVAELDALRLVLKRDRRWPDGDPRAAAAKRPPNFGLGGVDTKATRKWSAVGATVVLGGVTLLTFSPAILASRDMRAFCAAVPVGAPIADVQAKAEASRYGITKLQTGGWLFEHPRSMGRATCTVRVDAEARITATIPGL